MQSHLLYNSHHMFNHGRVRSSVFQSHAFKSQTLVLIISQCVQGESIFTTNKWSNQSRKEEWEAGGSNWGMESGRERCQRGLIPFLPTTPRVFQQFENTQALCCIQVYAGCGHGGVHRRHDRFPLGSYYQVREADIDKEVWWKADLAKYLNSSLIVASTGDRKVPPHS